MQPNSFNRRSHFDVIILSEYEEETVAKTKEDAFTFEQSYSTWGLVLPVSSGCFLLQNAGQVSLTQNYLCVWMGLSVCVIPVWSMPVCAGIKSDPEHDMNGVLSFQAPCDVPIIFLRA